MIVAVDFTERLWFATLAATTVAAILLFLPKVLRRRCGAGVAYAAWWLFPVSLIAGLLPARFAGGDASGQSTVVLNPLIVPMRAIAEPVMNTPAPIIDHSFWWLLIWSAGTVWMATRLWRDQRRFVGALGEVRHEYDDLWRAQARHGLPALVGALRTRIVIPEDFERRYDEEERRLMLAHERLHRRRWDHLANVGVAIVRCLFWFNPIVHRAAKAFRHDQELACDEAVIAAHPHSRRTYGEAMLKTLMTDRQAPLGCHWQGFHPLKERIMLLNTSPPRVWARRAGVVMVAMLTVSAGFAAWSSQRAEAPSLLEKNVWPPAPGMSPADTDGVFFTASLKERDQRGRLLDTVTTVVWMRPGATMPVEMTYPMTSDMTPTQMEAHLDSHQVDGVKMMLSVSPAQSDEVTVKVDFFERVKGQLIPSGAEPGRDDGQHEAHSDRVSKLDRDFRGGAYRSVVEFRRGPAPIACAGGVASSIVWPRDSRRAMPKFECVPEPSAPAAASETSG